MRIQSHVAGLKRDESLVLKPHRLAREEQVTLAKKRGGKKGDDKQA